MNRLFRSGGPASLLLGVALCLFLLGNGITREVPLGSIRGTARMSENGKGLAGARIILRPQFVVEGMAKSRELIAQSDGRFALTNIPAGDYTVEASARAHSLGETRVSISEGRATAIELALEPSEPYLELSANRHVFTADEEPSFVLSGFVDEPEASIKIYKATDEQIIAAGGISGVFDPVASWNSKAEAGLANFGKPVQTLAHKIDSLDPEGVFNSYVNLPAMPNGVYWVEVRMGPKRKGMYLNVTSLSVVVKTAGDQMLCFASNIKSGRPASGVEVSFASGGKVSPAATTGKDGTATFQMAKDESGSPVLIVASKKVERAFVSVYPSGRSEAGSHRIFTYTDRPVYRPGDEVKFKGIVRKLKGDGYVVPQAGQKIEVKVLDVQENLIEKQTLTIDRYGTFNGRFSFNREAPPGSYLLVCGFGDSEERHYVTVSAYRKPEFTVKVKPEKKFYVRGDRGRAMVECEYFFGGPVVGAKVKATITRSSYWSYGGEDEEQYSAEDGDSGGEYLQEVEAVTDGTGRAVIEFDTKLENDPAKAESDYLYTISALVGEGDKYFDGSGSVRVTRGEFGLQVQTDKYVVGPNEDFEVSVSAQWHKDETPAAGRQVRVEIGSETWTGNTSEFRVRSTRTVTTGADGKATVKLASSEGGSISIKAIAQDDLGNGIEATSYVWVDTQGAEAPGPPPPEMKLRLDKKKYGIGDTARLLIQTSEPGGSALVTLEGDRIYWSQVVALDKKATILSLPIAPSYAPNAFVSISYVRGKKYMDGSQELMVVATKRELKVSIQSDKPSYRPGDTAVYTIETSDAGGAPVAADVSLGVVDEGIYAIKKDETDILRSFYPMRSNSVQTGYSFPELFLDGGDKTPADIQVRSKFLDTAKWIPNIETDASGTATVSVQLPDNLTSWRATAIAASADTAVGQATMNVKARKDLMIRLQLPSFLVRQDVQTITATVVNDSGKEAEVNVDLQSSIPVDGDMRRTVTISPGEPATLEWTAKANQAGVAAFEAKAWITNGASDGVRASVPLKPHGRLNVDQSAGMVAGSETVNLMIRPGADPNTGRLLITVTPSLAAAMVRSLDKLIDYPYGCVEQTMSRFVPAVIAERTLRVLGLSLPRAKEVPKIVVESYQRLKNMESSEGGWGWWKNDKPDPYMTAYVLEGVHNATQAGYGKHALSIDKALDWIVASLKKKEAKTWKRADRLYLSYTLALFGKADQARAFIGAENLDNATSAELAFAILANKTLGNIEAAKGLLARLVASGSETASTMRWSEGDYYGSESTGRAFQAIQAMDPKHPLLPKIVRYLMLDWRDEMWSSTRDSAVVIGALSDYIMFRKEGANPANIAVSVNGSPIPTQGSLSVFGPDKRIELPISALRQGKNGVKIAVQGGGECYYSIDLRQNLVQEQLGQVISGSGLTISRRYFALAPQKLEDGTLRLMTSSEAIDEIESGKPVRVVLTIQSSKALEFMMVEDPIPSNCRVMDRGARDEFEEWTWWYSEMASYDDKVTFFMRNLPAGTQKLEYTIRAESPGVGHALPAVLSSMYEPGIRATSSESLLEVRPK